MIESAAYDIIKQDGVKEGIQEGMVLSARDMLLDVVETRFEKIPDDIYAMVNRISDRSFLKLLHKQAITCVNLDVLRKKLAQTEQ